jgi:hypothetical protein
MAGKLASRRGSQNALLQAQDDLCAQMVSTAGRTASGRQRRPTEKETYRSKQLCVVAQFTSDIIST